MFEILFQKWLQCTDCSIVMNYFQEKKKLTKLVEKKDQNMAQECTKKDDNSAFPNFNFIA